MNSGFADRHVGIDASAEQHMLATLGYDSVEALVEAAVPPSIHVAPIESSSIPAPASEREALAELRAIAGFNKVRRSMIGLGYYDTITPAVIKRNVLENPSWYTAYTPYQPEISQGRLEALINFQTMVSDLTGLATANASMLDEGTAVVEGMLLARRASKSTSNVFVVDADALPQTKALLHSRAAAVGIELVELDLAAHALLPVASHSSESAASRTLVEEHPTESAASRNLPDAFGIFIQYPGASGRAWNPASVIAEMQQNGGLAVVAADLLALTL
ncbi:MAG: glycine dehydrogenase (aminomethyl-transferring), partial [Mycetocola sp.]